jgi:hypothetical protein
MHSWACLPSSHARSLRAEASFAMVVCMSRTYRYSSVSLASSSRACASYAAMSALLVGEVGGALGPEFLGVSPAPAPISFVPSACSLTMTTKHSRAGS